MKELFIHIKWIILMITLGLLLFIYAILVFFLNILETVLAKGMVEVQKFNSRNNERTGTKKSG